MSGKHDLPAPFKLVSDLLKFTTKHGEGYDKKTVTRIRRAWENGAGIDPIGYIWVDADKLDIILRTTKKNATVMVDSLRDQERQTVGDTIYVYGPSVAKLLSVSVGRAEKMSKEKYLQVSTDHYNEIQFSDAAKGIRAEYREAMNKARASLKKKRIKAYGIVADELTGEPLATRAEFSHIRSVHIYPDLAMEIENGLVVNPETHRDITARDITEEAGLADYCRERGWSLAWEPEYQGWLKAMEKWRNS